MARQGEAGHFTEADRMLVLVRTKNEQIVIGDEEIVITVVAIRDTSVRLGITADRATPVHRREVFEVLKRVAKDEKNP